jgi:hypothetical protein
MSVPLPIDGGERLLPGEDVHVVGVDQRAVDIEENGFDLHEAIPDLKSCTRPSERRSAVQGVAGERRRQTAIAS